MSFFSIIVPVYNAEKYIKRCIDSICYQTFTDIEIIAINDGSSDNSLNILEELAGNDPRIKVFSEVNSGQVIARNTGISKSTGEYVGFVDADDYIEKDLFQTIYDDLLIHRSDIVMFDALMHKADGSTELMQKKYENGFYNKDDLRKSVYPNMLYLSPYYNFGCYPCLWNKVFRKSIIAKANKDVPTIIRNGEDACATYGALLLAESFRYIKGYVGYHYMINETSVTQMGNHSTTESLIALTDYLCENQIYKDEPLMKTQIMYYGCVMYIPLISLLRKSNLRYDQYPQIKNSTFGQLLNDEYKSLKDLPEFERCMLEGVFNPSVIQKIKMFLVIVKLKLGIH